MQAKLQTKTSRKQLSEITFKKSKPYHYKFLFTFQLLGSVFALIQSIYYLLLIASHFSLIEGKPQRSDIFIFNSVFGSMAVFLLAIMALFISPKVKSYIWIFLLMALFALGLIVLDPYGIIF